MASRLTPIGWITKFIVAPAAVAAIGFYVVGPRVGAVRPSSKPSTDVIDEAPESPPSTAQSAKPTAQTQPPNEKQGTTQPTNPGSPNLGQDADSTAASTQANDDNPKPRTRHRGKPPVNLVAPPTDPTPDDGGSAGNPVPTTPGTTANSSTTGR